MALKLGQTMVVVLMYVYTLYMYVHVYMFSSRSGICWRGYSNSGDCQSQTHLTSRNIGTYTYYYLSTITCTCMYMINKARQRYTPRTAFSFFKEKTDLSGIRTHDTPRSRRALYQLSYIPGQLSWLSSNPGIQGKATNLINR